MPRQRIAPPETHTHEQGEVESKSGTTETVLGLPVYFQHLEIKLSQANISYKAGASTEKSKSTWLRVYVCV